MQTDIPWQFAGNALQIRTTAAESKQEKFFMADFPFKLLQAKRMISLSEERSI